MGDDAFDSCVMPNQLLHGEAIWGGGTNYLLYLLFLATYDVLGFGVTIASAVSYIAFSISIAALATAIFRCFGSVASILFFLVTTLSYPFIFHSIFAAATIWAVVPTAIVLALLMIKPTAVSLSLAMFVAVFSVLFYPGAILTCAPLLGLHIIFFRERWRSKRSLWATCCLVIGVLAVFLIRQSVQTPNDNVLQWAGGFMRMEHWWESVKVVLNDMFWKSTSWNTLNYNVPYVEPALLGFVSAGLISWCLSLRRNSKEAPEHIRWIVILVLSALASVLLSGFAWPYPGVRRVFGSVLLLNVAAALACRINIKRIYSIPLVVATALVLILIGLRSTVLINKHWPLAGPSHYVDTARSYFLSNQESNKIVLITAYNVDQFRAQHYRCALELDARISNSFEDVQVIPRAQLVERTRALQGRGVIFLANETFSIEEIEKMFSWGQVSINHIQDCPRARANAICDIFIIEE
ncbi:MAG: hypothetical protein IID60_10900 [Proteobacteria bacterium]|nr:hypothetical protein [Pseudomonadota bacterium]